MTRPLGAPHDPQREARRRELARLLGPATDAKLRRGDRTAARSLFEEAIPLAAQAGTPWPEVIAYRLAHLYMREDPPRLEDADRLFQRACDLDLLGPWPWIYRSAVLHRRGLDSRRCLEEARGRLGQGSGSPEQRAGLQSTAHNLLELAVYFTGAPYRLDGCGGPWEDLFPTRGAWVLLGPSPETATVRYCKELALAELQTRDREGAIVYTAHGQRGRLRRAGEEDRDFNFQELRLLGLLQEGRCTGVSALMDIMDLPSNENYRQAKTRLKRTLVDISGSQEVFAPPAGPDVPRVTIPNLYGAVPAALLRCHARVTPPPVG